MTDLEETRFCTLQMGFTLNRPKCLLQYLKRVSGLRITPCSRGLPCLARVWEIKGIQSLLLDHPFFHIVSSKKLKGFLNYFFFYCGGT